MMWTVVFGAFLAVTSAFNLPGVPIDFTVSDEILSAVSDDIATKFADEYVYYMKTGIETASLRELSKQLAKAHSKKDMFTKDPADLGAADSFVMCTTCRATARVAAAMIREEDGELNGPAAEENARKMTLDICNRLELQTEEVCEGLFESNYPIIDFITRETVIDSYSFCSLFMEYSFCNIKNPEYNWTLTINANGQPITGPKADVPKSGADDWTILHLTDIHHDPLYKPGALAECDEPLCCQRHENEAQGTSKAAGYWGDYRDCDFPWHTIEKSLQHIQKTHPKIDMIYQTGDVVDHMVWGTSKEKNIEVLTKVDDKLEELFPGVAVYPCIGNHEPHPLNAFSPSDVPDDVNTKWMYEQLYNSWSRWLPASTKDTILAGGYYTVSPKPGFRIIALNNNDCYNMNWWLFYSGVNKQSQLMWLHDTLLAAEQANEHVHILAHIPTGDGSCWSVWSREANRIYERFNKIISGIFNGHSHKDEMNVHYSSNGHAIGISWNGGALTTFSYKNPNYRLYQVETTTKQVVNHETWIFDLNAANEAGEGVEPAFFKEYDFNTEFTTDLSPNGLDKLLDEFATKPDLLRKFWQYKMTSAEPSIKGGCNRGCLMSTICRLATTVNDQKKRCNELMAKLAIALDDETSTTGGSTATTPTTSPTSPTTQSSSSSGPTSSGTASTSSPTSTETTPSTQAPPEDDGAASIFAMSFSSLLGLYVLLKCLI